MLSFSNIIKEEEEIAFFLTLCHNIKAIRKKRKMSQLDVALALGHKSSGFYANLENYAHGKHFNLKHLLRLSKLFDVPIEAFFKPLK
jgi:transcriptional regulator with XRE-family HTH domain